MFPNILKTESIIAHQTSKTKSKNTPKTEPTVLFALNSINRRR
jgi:hypothetical protein